MIIIFDKVIISVTLTNIPIMSYKYGDSLSKLTYTSRHNNKKKRGGVEGKRLYMPMSIAITIRQKLYVI